MNRVGGSVRHFEGQWIVSQESQISFEDFRSSLVMARKTFELTQDAVHTAQTQTGGRLPSIRAKLTESMQPAMHAHVSRQHIWQLQTAHKSNYALPTAALFAHRNETLDETDQ